MQHNNILTNESDALKAIAISLHHLTLDYLNEHDHDAFGNRVGTTKAYLADYKNAHMEEIK